MAMASDTLSISKDLRAAGFNEQQADALAMHMAAFPSNLVTKEDLALEVSRLDHKIDQASVASAAQSGCGPCRCSRTHPCRDGHCYHGAILLNQLG